MTLLLGAVAYDPKVVTIWDGFRRWLRENDLDFDYVLYSNYERQVVDLVEGQVDVAWNSPLAWVRAHRIAEAKEIQLRPVTMRDTDCDLRSAIVVLADSPVRSLADLQGRIVATGAIDSPQSTLLPVSALRAAGLTPGTDVTIKRFDVGVGLHGDHIGGEREAAKALAAGEVDAACVIDSNLLLFGHEGTLPAGTRVVGQTDSYDHCTMTAGPSVDNSELDRFAQLLFSMSYADPAMRPLLELEGLKQWRPPRLDGYELLERAVDESGFYDSAGAITEPDYRP